MEVLKGPRQLLWALAAFSIFAGCHKPSVANGARIFARDCARCHLPHPGQSVSAPSLSAYFDRTPRSDASEVRRIIRDGWRYMPSFGSRLSSEEIDDVIAYIKTLR
jgi:mono/diheme cytochrome c family protein